MYELDETDEPVQGGSCTEDTCSVAMDEITSDRNSKGRSKTASAGSDVLGIAPGGCVIDVKDDNGNRSRVPKDVLDKLPTALPERVKDDNGSRVPKDVLDKLPVVKPISEQQRMESVLKELESGKIGKATMASLFTMTGDQLEKFVSKVNEELAKHGLKLNVDDSYMIVCGDPKTQGTYFNGRFASLTDTKTGKVVHSAKVPTIYDFTEGLRGGRHGGGSPEPTKPGLGDLINNGGDRSPLPTTLPKPGLGDLINNGGDRSPIPTTPPKPGLSGLINNGGDRSPIPTTSPKPGLSGLINNGGDRSPIPTTPPKPGLSGLINNGGDRSPIPTTPPKPGLSGLINNGGDTCPIPTPPKPGLSGLINNGGDACPIPTKPKPGLSDINNGGDTCPIPTKPKPKPGLSDLLNGGDRTPSPGPTKPNESGIGTKPGNGQLSELIRSLVKPKEASRR